MTDSHGHLATGGIEERIESTLPPVRRPNTVPAQNLFIKINSADIAAFGSARPAG